MFLRRLSGSRPAASLKPGPLRPGGRRRATGAILAAAVCLGLGPVRAQIPDGITFAPVFGTDGPNKFIHPAVMLEIPGKPGHFLVPEMGTGKIWVLAPGASGYAKTQFGQVKGQTGEEDMGLIGFAFHPEYAKNRKYYVKYGNPQRPPRQLCVDERSAAADYLHDSGQPPRRLLTVTPPEEFNDHNGGSPVFGPDGYLYLNFGDGGWDLETPDLYKHGQNRQSLLSKILRIDVNGKDPGLEYAIPKDNPFVNEADPKVRREIWAYGLRNPYRLSFDRATGELYVGDVGWIKYDEVDIVKKGGNYGWSLKESVFCLEAGKCDGVAIEDPLAAMANGAGPGMAKCVIGGQVYRGNPASPFFGVYLFGDHTLSKLFALKKPASGPATVKEYPLTTPQQPISFTLDSLNNIYMVGYTGTIYKLEHPQLTAATTAVQPGPGDAHSVASHASQRGTRVLAVFSGPGALALPRGLAGEYEALTPQGVRLGRVSASRSTGVTGPGALGLLEAGGLILLRPVPGE